MPDDELIRLPRRFVLTIYGDTERWLHNSVPHAEMVYALIRLFWGRPAARGTFDRWPMTVWLSLIPTADLKVSCYFP